MSYDGYTVREGLIVDLHRLTEAKRLIENTGGLLGGDDDLREAVRYLTERIYRVRGIITGLQTAEAG